MKSDDPKVALHGATGRMGAALFNLCRKQNVAIVGAAADPACAEVGHDLGQIHGSAAHGVVVESDIPTALLGADVVVDFSHESAVVPLARAAQRAKVPLVTGTTGLGTETLAALDDLASVVPVLWAPNFSLGIQVLAELVRHAAQRLGPAFDVELVEVHHRHKVDAPSGTATRLAGEVQAVRPDLNVRHGRQGHVGARAEDEMAVMALRGGDVVGDHTVHLMGPAERLELTHRATSREVFAQGALFAARAVVTRPPGRLTLADILS